MIEQIQLIIVCLGIVFGIGYTVLIFSYCYGWVKTPLYTFKKLIHAPRVSIVIAARNEEVSIKKCINSILKQNYPKDFYEIIVVDDHSTDATFQLVSVIAYENKNIKILQLQQEQTGKKQAIELGIQSATGDIIVTTDADCIMGEEWLETMVSFLINSSNKMAVGPVAYTEEKNCIEKFQSLELIALTASGAGSLYYNNATLCNGANLIYYKKAFQEVDGYEGLKSIASGDDVLLMYKMNKRFPKQIAFVKNNEAIVFTKAKASLKEFYFQRKRWASKGLGLLNAETRFVAVTVMGFNSILLIMLFISLLYFLNIPLYVFFVYTTFILWSAKWFIDFLLLFLASSFFNKRKFLIYFFSEQIFYSFYILIIGLFGRYGNYEWKERKIKL